MKQRIFRTAAAILATVLFTFSAFAAPRVSAQCAILIDADSGAVLLSQNADKRSLIASTTKIMTAVVVLEHCPLDMEYTVPAQATQIEGSSIYLKAGETITVRDLLYGMMLHSGNDAAVALALACSDSVPEFVALMNLKAQQLGLKNTHFENPNGLDGENHYSTAADLALLTRYALNIDAFRQIVSTKSICIGQRALKNHNRLLWSVEGAIGVKTGYTKAAGRVLVSAAERNGRRLIAVTINDGNDWQDHASLYDYGFSRYNEKETIHAGECVLRLPLMDGKTALLAPAQPFSCYLADEESVRVELLYPRAAFSAGERGTFAGFGAVCLGEKQLGVIRLVWGGLEDEYGGALTEDSIGTRHCVPSCG